MVALVVPFAARVPDYKQKYDDLKKQLDSQIQQNSIAAEKARDEIGNNVSADEKLLAEKEALQKQVNDLSTQLAKQYDNSGDLGTSLEVLTAQGSLATTINKTQDEQIASQTKLIKDQFATIAEQKQQIASLNQTMIGVLSKARRLETSLERIQGELKAKEQQLEEQTAEAAKLKDKLVKLAGKDAAKPSPQPVDPIVGSIVSISQIRDGLTMVQINVGKSDKVKKGMEFVVYRGDNFVGKIEITDLDTAESVGRLTLGGNLKEGDAVKTDSP